MSTTNEVTKLLPLRIDLFNHKGASSFTLYEDDGVSYDYQKGIYATTTFKCVEKDRTLTVTRSAPRGKYKIPERDHIFEIHKKMTVKQVTSDKKQLPRFKEKPAFDSATHGWFYDERRNIIWAKLKGGANKPISLTFYNDAGG